MENTTTANPKSIQIELGNFAAGQKDVELRELINDERRRVVEVSIRAGSVLKRHHAVEPITVLCLKGECSFASGKDLETAVEMQPGTFLALDAGIDHEVSAGGSDVKLIVSKFK